MSNYIAIISLPEQISEHLASLIPKQRYFVEQLIQQGIIVNYALSMDRKKLWVTLSAKTIRQARKTVDSFPIAPYVEYEIQELMFQLQQGIQLSTVSLN